jgi:Polyketide cyclase / dehydrase and lipid transport
MSRIPQSRAETWVRWPMIFRLEAADATLLAKASHGFSLEREYRAEPDVVHRSFLAFVGDPPWSPGFLGVDWWTPRGRLDDAEMDELYAFMAMRVRVFEHTPGRRSLSYVDRWSLPLARRMVQLIETDPLPGGGTRLRYRVAYDPPAVFARVVAPVEWAFKRWFEASLDGLGRLVDGPR